MLRDCGSGPCAAVTVAESPIWFHSITVLTGVARGAGEPANTSAAVASPRVARATLLRMRIDMRTSLAREHRDQGGGRSWGTCGNSVEARPTGWSAMSSDARDKPQKSAGKWTPGL